MTTNKHIQGIIYTVFSAVIFGLSPALVRMTYNEGANGITMVFLRSLIALPALYFLALRFDGSLAVSPLECGKMILLVGCGSGLTTILLYGSYAYIPVGIATTLHFVYPLLVNLFCILFLREPFSLVKGISLILGTGGIFLFTGDGGGLNPLGVALALLSGMCYAFYILYMSVSGLNRMGPFKLVFYSGIITCVITGFFGIATGQLTFALTPKAWVIAAIVSLAVCLGAFTCFQLGIRYTGPSTAAILSTMEPITSVVIGWLVLNETWSLQKITGCIAIMSSVILVTTGQINKIKK